MHRRDAGGSGVAAGSAEGFEERDHPLSLCYVGQPPAAGPEIVRHVLRVAGAGITAVTASLPRRYLRKNWPQLAASKSAAHSSGFCPRSTRKSRLRANGRSVNCGRGQDHPLLRRAVGERIIDLKKIRLLAPHHRLDGIEVAGRGGGDPEIPAETLRLPFCAVSPNPGADRRHCGAASNRHGWCGAAAMRLTLSRGRCCGRSLRAWSREKPGRSVRWR